MSNLDQLYHQVLAELGEDVNREGLLDLSRFACSHHS